MSHKRPALSTERAAAGRASRLAFPATVLLHWRPMKTGTIEKRIFKAGLFVAAAHLLFRLAGLIQAKVMGHYLPKETFDVVFTFAFTNCLFMVFLIGEELLNGTFLPVFMGEKDKASESSAWAFANTVLTLQFIILLAVTAVFLVAPDMVVRMLTRWRSPASARWRPR